MSGGIGISGEGGAPSGWGAVQLRHAHALAALSDARQALRRAQAVVDTDHANHNPCCVRADQPAVDRAAAQVAQARNAAEDAPSDAAPPVRNTVDPAAAPGAVLSLIA